MVAAAGVGAVHFQHAAIATKNLTFIIFCGSLKWTVFIRVCTIVYRVKNASVCDNTVMRPADNGGVTQCYRGVNRGRLRSLHGGRRCEREWARSISTLNFPGGSLRSSWITTKCSQR